MSFIIILILILLLVRSSSTAANEKNKNRALNDNFETLKKENKKLVKEQSDLFEKVSRLRKYEAIEDVEKEIRIQKEECKEDIKTARAEAKAIREKANTVLSNAETSANDQIKAAKEQSKTIIINAERKAREIAGEAYDIAGKAKEYEKVAKSMKNIIKGYGTEYIKPTHSLLDELASDFGHTEAGEKLKQARENSARMVKAGLAAECDYVEQNRRETAIAFVVDAFNGKVDSILSKTKRDNYGILEQKILDAFQLVNYNGTAFKNARITSDYLDARLMELKWGTIVSELKVQAQEEQRRIREQMREEEKVRKEQEKAIKDAQKEEEMLRKAQEKARKQFEAASEAKKAEFEAKLLELENKLKDAEERSKRATSMAQQTKHGNVYVISNIGAFGENVYKIGMTRRLEPMDRVKELGDASVPFPFDVHAIIESDDAPALETALHKAFASAQVNKVNPRKEFFKVSLSDVKTIVDQMGLKANWTMMADAAEYRETLVIEEQMKANPEMKKEWENFATNHIKEDCSCE